MDTFDKNRNVLICALVVLIAGSALFMLHRMNTKEGFDTTKFDDSYFIDPNPKGLESRIETTTGMSKTVLSIASGVVLFLVIGIVFYISSRKGSDTLPEQTDEE